VTGCRYRPDPLPFSRSLYFRPLPSPSPAHGRFVTEDMLLKCMPKASAESVVLMCGPPVMIDRAVKPNLEKLGFDKAQMLAF